MDIDIAQCCLMVVDPRESSESLTASDLRGIIKRPLWTSKSDLRGSSDSRGVDLLSCRKIAGAYPSRIRMRFSRFRRSVWFRISGDSGPRPIWSDNWFCL